MSYDVLLSRSPIPGRVNPGFHDTSPPDIVHKKSTDKLKHRKIPDNVCVEEELPAKIIHLPVESEEKPPKRAETPMRKISSSRFIAVFTQFYGNDDDNDSGNNPSGPQRCVASNGIGDESFPEIKGRVESKLMSMWHNVKYGWSGKMRSNFSKEQPVWLLGRCYHSRFSPVPSMESSVEMTSSLENRLYPNEPFLNYDDLVDPTVQEFGTDAIEGENMESVWEASIEGFKRDFQSRLWMTYRREFPTMNGSNYTSDCGWGCMLRSGQMLLSQALICHFLNRNWRWDPDTQIHSTHDDAIHRKIIKWFGDSASKNSPFSIHTMVTIGQENQGKKPGDWYGPSSVSHLLREAVKLASHENADFDDINVYVAQDCTVYIQDIMDQCLVPEPPLGSTAPWQKRKKSTGFKLDKMQWKSLILLVPLRLGAEKLNPIYGNCLKTLLSTEYCIGIIGGRPKHSLYFVGFQEDKLIHLDPHYCQEMVDVNQENFSVNSFHCKSPRKLKLSKLDPSCCIGFYCKTKIDFDNFVATVQPFLLPVKLPPGDHRPPGTGASPCHQYQPSNLNSSSTNTQTADISYPMFVFSNGKHCDQEIVSRTSDSLYKPLTEQLRQMQIDEESGRRSAGFQNDDDDNETEEFVII